MAKQNDAKRFNELQEKGAQAFGLRWLVVSQAVVDTASVNGLNVPQNKTVLAAIAYKMCSLYQSWESQHPNVTKLDELIAEGKARNWQDVPGTTITVAEALQREGIDPKE